jgi:uncharacterized protein involved in exopolysaccharide biosynthesis
MIPTSAVPRAGLEYVRSLRDLRYNETLFELLSKQYEAARIDEAKEAPLIQVIDLAVPPERRSWPPRMWFVLTGVLGCSLLASVVTVGCSRHPEVAAKFRLLRRKLMGMPRSERSPSA